MATAEEIDRLVEQQRRNLKDLLEQMRQHQLRLFQSTQNRSNATFDDFSNAVINEALPVHRVNISARTAANLAQYDAPNETPPTSETLRLLAAAVGCVLVPTDDATLSALGISPGDDANARAKYSFDAQPTHIQWDTAKKLESLGFILHKVANMTEVNRLNAAIKDLPAPTAAAPNAAAADAKLRADNARLQAALAVANTENAWLKNTPPATLESTIARAAMDKLAKNVSPGDWSDLLAFLQRGQDRDDLALLYKNGVTTHMQLTPADMAALTEASTRGFTTLNADRKKSVQRCAEAANAMLRLATNPKGTGAGRGYGLELDDEGKSKSCWEMMRRGAGRVKQHFRDNRLRYAVAVSAAVIGGYMYCSKPVEPPPAPVQTQTQPQAAPSAQQQAVAAEQNFLRGLETPLKESREILSLKYQVDSAGDALDRAENRRDPKAITAARRQLLNAEHNLKSATESYAFNTLPDAMKLVDAYLDTHKDVTGLTKHKLNIVQARSLALQHARSEYTDAQAGTDAEEQYNAGHTLDDTQRDLTTALFDLGGVIKKDLEKQPPATQQPHGEVFASYTAPNGQRVISARNGAPTTETVVEVAGTTDTSASAHVNPDGIISNEAVAGHAAAFTDLSAQPDVSWPKTDQLWGRPDYTLRDAPPGFTPHYTANFEWPGTDAHPVEHADPGSQIHPYLQHTTDPWPHNVAVEAELDSAG